MALTDEVQEISLEGFQVVGAELFAHYQRLNVPMVTLWDNAIGFSKAAISALNNCDHVRIEVNLEKKGIVLIPVTSKDKDGIRWMKTGNEIQGRKLECRLFTGPLFQAWKWNTDYVYRTPGRIVVCDQKVMLFFDFTSPESWPFKAKTKAKNA